MTVRLEAQLRDARLNLKNLNRQSNMTSPMNGIFTGYSKIPGVAFLYHQPTQEKMDESLPGPPALFGVTIFGPDMNTLVALAAQVEKVMAQDPSLTNIVNNTKIMSPQIIVRPNPVELARCGFLHLMFSRRSRRAGLGLRPQPSNFIPFYSPLS